MKDYEPTIIRKTIETYRLDSDNVWGECELCGARHMLSGIAPEMVQYIMDLEAALRQTNKMIAIQIKDDQENLRPARAELWQMRYETNEGILADAEEET